MTSKISKPITELTSEQLLELLKENPQEVPTFEYSNDVLDFLSTYGIKEGPNKIFVSLIYGLYKRWSKKPIYRTQFGMELSKLFDSFQGTSKLTKYQINKSKEFFLEKSVKKGQNKTKRKPWLGHFLKFKEYYKLKSGSFYIKDVVLYNLYDKWVYKNNNKNPLSMHQFLKFCRLFFQNPAIKIVKGHEYFSINSETKEYLTPDLINLMKQK